MTTQMNDSERLKVQSTPRYSFSIEVWDHKRQKTICNKSGEQGSPYGSIRALEKCIDEIKKYIDQNK